MIDVDECRREFEAWVGTFPAPSPLDRGETGNYLYRDIWFSWEAWQAAWRRAAKGKHQ